MPASMPHGARPADSGKASQAVGISEEDLLGMQTAPVAQSVTLLPKAGAKDKMAAGPSAHNKPGFPLR
jgi:hypothetical protein